MGTNVLVCDSIVLIYAHFTVLKHAKKIIPFLLDMK